jgi:hypothetical protein
MLPLARIDLSDILVAHVRTLRTLGKPGINKGEVFFFFGLPALIALPLAYYFGDRLYDQAPKLLTVVSLVGGFLFNLLARTSQIVDKAKKESASGSVRRIYAKEIHSNVAFGIIIALGCAASLVAYSFVDKPTARHLQGQIGLAWLNFFLFVAFFLTLLMIIKRMFIILSSDVEDL